MRSRGNNAKRGSERGGYRPRHPDPSIRGYAEEIGVAERRRNPHSNDAERRRNLDSHLNSDIPPLIGEMLDLSYPQLKGVLMEQVLRCLKEEIEETIEVLTVMF